MSENREKNLETLLAISTGLLILYFVFRIQILIPIAAILSVMGLLSSYFAGKITLVWYKIVQIMGWIMSRIILSVIFYLFLYPLSLLYRLSNKDNLLLKRKPTSSYYFSRDQEYSAKDFENTW